MSKARDIADSTKTLDVDGGTIKLDGNYPVGTDNVALGDTALDSNVSGAAMVAIGAEALNASTAASGSVAVGYRAAYNTTTGNNNLAVGNQSLLSNTTGQNNIAVGSLTLYNSTGDNNTAIGANSLQSNTTASNNTAVGYQAGYSNTTGGSNTAVGYQALTNSTTPSDNTALGFQALKSNTTATNNTATGMRALENNTTGASNTAVGREALKYNTTASNNTAFGYQAGYSTTTGGSNTYIGNYCGYAMTTGINNTILGRYSGNEGGLDIRTSNNNIVLSDGAGNPQISVMQDGYTYFNKSGNQSTLTGLQHGAINANLSDSSLARNGAIFSNVASGYIGLGTQASGAHNYYAGYFRNSSSTVVGSIVAGLAGTTFNTTSDHRLKENVVNLTGATTRLKQLEPKRFNFIADADTTVDGFLAHEVQSVVPEAIHGTKDEVDDDGNPVYQGIDQSKLVPLLVATIKELEARITALENA